METTNGLEKSSPIPKWVVVFALTSLVFGIVARWIWASDMIWLGDQRWLYDRSQHAGIDEPWPRVGMPTSLGFPNPGLSAWYGILLGRRTNGPVQMVQVVIALNIVALIGLAILVRKKIPAEEREPWIWAWAMYSVNALGVEYSRIIWQQCFLPPWTLSTLVGHLYRRTRIGAFFWGLTGGLIGQIHISGFFLSLMFFLGTVVQEVLARTFITRWRWWILGSFLAMIPLIPWFQAIYENPTIRDSVLLKGNTRLERILFVCRHWRLILAGGPFDDALPSLDPSTWTGPIDIFRWGTHVCLAAIFVRGILRTVRSRETFKQLPLAWFYSIWLGIGTTLLFAVAVRVVFDHYFIVFLPFLYLAVCAFALPDRKLLAALMIFQALVTCHALINDHVNGHPYNHGYINYSKQDKIDRLPGGKDPE